MLFLLCIIEREREFAASWQPNLSFYTTLYPTSLKGRIKDNERGRLLRGGQECPRMAFFNDVPLLVQSSLRMSSKCMERTARGPRPYPARPPEMQRGVSGSFVCSPAHLRNPVLVCIQLTSASENK